MRVADAVDVFRRSAELDRLHQFLDQMAGIGADDMGADHLLGLFVLEDLHEAVGHGPAARARLGGARELASPVGGARGCSLFLRSEEQTSEPQSPMRTSYAV